MRMEMKQKRQIKEGKVSLVRLTAPLQPQT